MTDSELQALAAKFTCDLVEKMYGLFGLRAAAEATDEQLREQIKAQGGDEDAERVVFMCRDLARQRAGSKP